MSGLSMFLQDEIGGYERMWADAGAHRYDRHAHDEYSIIVLTEGEKIFRLGATEQVVRAGQVIVVTPGESHDCEALHGIDWAHRCWYVSPQFVAALMGDPSFETQPSTGGGVIDDPALAHRLCTVHSAALKAPDQSFSAEADALSTAFQKLQMANDPSASPKVTSKLRRSRIYEAALRDEHTEKLDLDWLAELGRVSKYQVIRDLTEARGMSPGRLLKDIRLRRSKELLRTGTDIVRVCQDLGFADQSHFTRAFRAAYGITPGQYSRYFRSNAA